MIMAELESPAEAFLSLTDKQREVLDRLIEHKTSKEIARELGISPHTVEQRLRYAKAKLGVERRSDLASTYRALRTTYKEIAYEDLCVDFPGSMPDPSVGTSERLVDAKSDASILNGRVDAAITDREVRIVPAMFEGRTGTWMRIGAIFVIALCIIVAGLAGLAVFEQLSRLLA